MVFSSLYRVRLEVIRGRKIAVSKWYFGDMGLGYDVCCEDVVCVSAKYHSPTALCRNPDVSNALRVRVKFVVLRWKGGDEWRM